MPSHFPGIAANSWTRSGSLKLKVTVPVYYWDDGADSYSVDVLFRKDSRVRPVVEAFLNQIEYDELLKEYQRSEDCGYKYNSNYDEQGRIVEWELSMEDHHMLYWAKNDPPNSYSLTGNDDTLLSNPIVGDNLARCQAG